MATVVNVTEISKRFEVLGWVNISAADVVDALVKNSIPAAQFIAYLDVVVATPAGFDDQTIAGCPAANATKITAALKSRGVEAV